jgi:apolipoprotein N-acyltransferase
VNQSSLAAGESRTLPVPWQTDVVLLLAGVAGVVAFAPFGWYPLAVLAPAVLFLQWINDTPRQAFRHGLVFGLGLFGFGISWVYVSIHTYGHVLWPVAGLIALLLILVMALYPALLGYALRRLLPGRAPLLLWLAFPAGWLLVEWLRGWLFTGFPWLDLGASQVDGPLSGYLPVLGEYGVTWLVVLSSGLLAAALAGRRRLLPLLVVALVWAGGIGLGRVAWTRPAGKPLTVSLVQGNIAQDEKWKPANLQGTLTEYADMTFGGPRSDLYVWPETAIPAFYDQVDEHYLPALQAKLAAQGSALLSGIPVLDRARWEYFNAVVEVATQPVFYFKQHLVPFGEYVPLRALVGWLVGKLVPMNGDFSRGPAHQPLLHAAGYPVGTSICFEVAFGRLIAADLPQAAMLVNVSNDGWFGASLAPHQHLEIARVRALETGRPLLRATNTGISAIIDPHGTVTARSAQFQPVVVHGSVVPMQGLTPFVRLGNRPVLAVCVLSLLAAFVTRRSRARQPPDR